MGAFGKAKAAIKMKTSLVSPSGGSVPGSQHSRYGSARYGTGIWGRRALRNPEKFAGIIADVPDIELIREDGMAFSYDDVTSSQTNIVNNFIQIVGGQGRYPLAYIQTGKEITFQFNVAGFNMDLFEATYSLTQEEGDFGTVESQRYMATKADNPNADKYGTAVFGVARFGLYYSKLVIPYECKIGSVNIRGLEEAEEPAPGKFSVYITRSDEDGGGRTVVYIHGTDAEVGDMIRVVYQRRVIASSKVSVKTMNKFAVCEFYSHWPSYNRDGVLQGMVHLYIPRTRVTVGPSIDTKYKTKGEISLTCAAITPPAHQDKWYDLIFEKADENGELYQKTSNKVEWN